LLDSITLFDAVIDEHNVKLRTNYIWHVHIFAFCLLLHWLSKPT